MKSLLAVPSEFIAMTVKLNSPDFSGIPEIVPSENNFNESGSEEPSASSHVIGSFPVAESFILYS